MVERYSKAIARRTLSNLPKVTPKDQKVSTAVASAWGQVAQTGAALSSQFAQYAREDARSKAISDAEGVEFGRTAEGVTIMPPPMTEGGTIYQQNYKTVVGDIYKREIKTDIETNLSAIFAKEFRNPEIMAVKLNDSLGSIMENVAPQNQTEMLRIGQNFINSYTERSQLAKTNELHNLNINHLQNEYEAISDKVLRFGNTPEEQALFEEKYDQINLNLAQLGAIHKDDIPLREQALAYVANFKVLQGIVNTKSAGSDGALLNSPENIGKLATLFQGYGDTVTLNDGEKNITYTQADIERLVPDPSLRTAMANSLRVRANQVGASLTISEKNQALKRIDIYYEKENTGTINGPDAKYDDEYHFIKVDNILTQNELYPEGISNWRQEIGKETTAKSSQAINFLSQYMAKFEVAPKFVITEFEKISIATPAELANFYAPLYSQIQKNPILLSLFNSKINGKIAGKLKQMSMIVNLGDDPATNEKIFTELASRLKGQTMEGLNTKLITLITGDTNTSKGYPTSGADIISAYATTHMVKSGVDVQSIDKELTSLVYNEVIDYLRQMESADGKPITLENLNSALDVVIKQTTKDKTNFKDYGVSGPVQKEDWNSYLLDGIGGGFTINELTKLAPTEENIAIKNISLNSKAFGGESKYAPIDYYSNVILKNLPEGTEIPIFNDPNNWESPSGLHNNKAVIEGSVIPDSSKGIQLGTNVGFTSKEEQENYEKTISFQDDTLPYNEEIYKPFTLNYNGNKIAMIYGKTYFYHRDPELSGDKFMMVVITDDGIKSVNGILEVDGKPLLFDLKAFKQSKAGDNKKLMEIEKLKEINKNKQNDIEDVEGTTTDVSELESLTKQLGKYIFGENKEKDQRKVTKIKNEIRLNVEEIKKKEKAIAPLKAITPTEASINIPVNGKGKQLVLQASDIIANILPGNNAQITSKFLQEIANVETHAGNNKDTYVGKNGDMGIWQNASALIEIQEQLEIKNRGGLIGNNVKIMEEGLQQYIPGFSFKKLTAQDLKNPLISGAVARIYIALKTSEVIPDNQKARSSVWKEFYNGLNGKGTVEDYLNANGFVE